MEESNTVLRKLEFQSDRKNINLVENLVDEISEEIQFNQDYYGNILIALTEAANNAIIHGNQCDINKKVTVSVTHTDSEVVFVVNDEGEGFDFDNLPDPTAPENIEKPDGRGIFLLKNLADEVEFKNSGSQLEIKFNLQG